MPADMDEPPGAHPVGEMGLPGTGTETFVRPTIRDVARLANVSTTTVSHALSAKRQVSPATAERIQAAIAYLGYVPSSAAQNLQGRRAMMLGLVVPSVSDPFFGELATGVEDFADSRGYGIVINSSGRAPSHKALFSDLLRSRAIDGMVYVAGGGAVDFLLPAMLGQYPIVLADEYRSELEGFPLVAANQRVGGVLAGEHLQSLGHRDVAVIGGPRGLRTAEDRLAGFLDVFPAAVVVDGDFTEEVGYYRTAKLLELSVRPTAIFASNDNAAIGAMDCARDRDLQVPRDLSVIGFDDISIARRITPSLTTIRQPTAEIGRRAAETLISLLDAASAMSPPLADVELVVRQSTASPR